MSFQDVGKRNSSRQPVNAAMGRNRGSSSTSTSSASNSNNISNNNNAASSSSSVFGSSSISAAAATSQISDSLTQYHRNVGILEKIAQALLSGQSGFQRDELEQQYKAQTDVLRQLEARLKEQIMGQRQRLETKSQTSSQKQALAKLERDFERVQSAVVTLQAKVSKQKKQHQQRGGNSSTNTSGTSNNTNTSSNATTHNAAKSALEQQQLLLQQDRLQEEIMREREEEIRKINKGMHQVNQIYKDLAHIVGEQQEDVDQIEDKMEESKTAAQSGLEQIHKANQSYGANANCTIM